PRRLAALRERALDRGKPALEVGVGGAQRGFRIGAQMTGEIDHRKQEIADLAGQALLLAFFQRGLDLVGFLANFGEHSTRVVPVEADLRGFPCSLRARVSAGSPVGTPASAAASPAPARLRR